MRQAPLVLSMFETHYALQQSFTSWIPKTNAQLRWTPQVHIFPEQTQVHTHDKKQTSINKSEHYVKFGLFNISVNASITTRWFYETGVMRSKKSSSRNSMMPPPKFAADRIYHDTSLWLLPNIACFCTWFSSNWLHLNSSYESEKTTTTSSPSAVLVTLILRFGLHANIQRQTFPHSLWESGYHSMTLFWPVVCNTNSAPSAAPMKTRNTDRQTPHATHQKNAHECWYCPCWL